MFQRLWPNGELDDSGSYEIFSENIKKGTIKLRYINAEGVKSDILFPTITFSPDKTSWTWDAGIYPGTNVWVDDQTSY